MMGRCVIKITIFFVIYFISQPAFCRNVSLVESCVTVKGKKPYIDCRNKGFSEIPDEILNSTIKQVYLSKNPYICDCETIRVFNQVKKEFLDIQDEGGMSCSEPVQQKGRLLRDVTEREACHKETKKPCDEILKPCPSAQHVCVNKGRSFQCKCKTGFYKEKDKDECTDLNECDLGHRCSRHAQCINLIGSYQCYCKQGYIGNGKHCEDLDECVGKKHDCHKDAVCVNKVGSFECRCKPGFKLSKDGKICEQEVFYSNISKQDFRSSSIIFAAAGGSGFVILLITVCICRKCCCGKRKSKKAATPTSVKSPLLPPSTTPGLAPPPPMGNLGGMTEQDYLAAQEMFMFDTSYFPDMPVPAVEQCIPPMASAITTWSEEDDDDDNSDYDEEI